jgi:hypothetical protein
MNKKIYYLLGFTWGIIMNILGALVAAAMTCIGRKPTRHGGSIVYTIGKDWGGLSLGIFSFVSEGASEHTLNHEFGHSIQNAIYGPLFPFIVWIPSVTRYWMIRTGKIKVDNYDDAWFEG